MRRTGLFVALQVKRLLTPRLSSVPGSCGSLSETLASTVPNVGITPVLMPERK